MLETLAGRLKWEQTGDGIRVVIPVRMPLLTALSGIWLFMLPHFTVEVFDKLRGFIDPRSFAPVWIGLCLVVLWFTMIFTTQQILTLNPGEIVIQVRIFGIGVKKRAFATSRLQCLRFVPSEYGDLISMNDMSRIQIDRDFKTRNFAFGITEQEADTLIQKMMEVYKFPKYPEINTTASVQVN
jgi:hypothetical protein